MESSAFTGLPETGSTFRNTPLRLDATRGFCRGLAFRAYREFSASTVLRVTAAVPIMLTKQDLYVDSGAARASITVGSTPTGTFAALPTKFSKNSVFLPQPTPSVSVDVLTGTLANGTEREVLRVNSGGGAGAASTLGGIRILPAGTYYINIVVQGSTTGVYSFEYEELV